MFAIFNEIFSYLKYSQSCFRFCQILRYLCLETDNPNEGLERNNPRYDPLWRVRWLLEEFNSKSTTLLVPACDIAVDEVSSKVERF